MPVTARHTFDVLLGKSELNEQNGFEEENQ